MKGTVSVIENDLHVERDIYPIHNGTLSTFDRRDIYPIHNGTLSTFDRRDIYPIQNGTLSTFDRMDIYPIHNGTLSTFDRSSVHFNYTPLAKNVIDTHTEFLIINNLPKG